MGRGRDGRRVRDERGLYPDEVNSNAEIFGARTLCWIRVAPMTDEARARLDEDLRAAEADVKRLRAENAALAEAFRSEPSDDLRELLRRAAASLAAARDRVDAAQGALTTFDKTGAPYGITTTASGVVGCIAVTIPPGTSHERRGRLIDDALTSELTDAARSLGVVLAAAPSRYVRERAGRDAEGRTVFDVAGRVEGDMLTPAVSRAARSSRRQ
jgi:hypothetical protein